jgi:hypothetical protein
MLAISALAAPTNAHEALFATGAAALLLLFIGIHNAWDGIVYHVTCEVRTSERSGASARRAQSGKLSACTMAWNRGTLRNESKRVVTKVRYALWWRIAVSSQSSARASSPHSL